MEDLIVTLKRYKTEEVLKACTVSIGRTRFIDEVIRRVIIESDIEQQKKIIEYLEIHYKAKEANKTTNDLMFAVNKGR